jgi:glycosyltransferase involved in cell wall biosynthesis
VGQEFFLGKNRRKDIGNSPKPMKKSISILPTITVVIATFNSRNTIDKCLSSVRAQNYPQEKIHIILADGGSADGTRDLAKKYDVQIIQVSKDKQNAEYNKGVAVRQATGEFLLMIDHDNVLPKNDWLQRMVDPLLENPEIVASNILRFTYDPTYSIVDRYIALFGATDPVAYYLGKADRLSYRYDTYNLFGKAQDKGDYYLVTFDRDHIPTLGANGFLIRRKALLENAQVDEDHFFHIDVNVDLINKGINKYAFVKGGIIHLSGYKDISGFLYRRKLFMEQYHIKNYSNRRYSVFMPQDKWRLAIFLLFTLTFIRPTYDAIRGFIKIRDAAWFLIPLLSFGLSVIYAYVIIKSTIRSYGRKLF